MTLAFVCDDMLGPDALALIGESEAELSALYAADVRYALSPDELRAQAVAFFVGYRAGRPVACGGVEALDGYAEMKRVFVTRTARGCGLAAQVMVLLEDHARDRGLPLMRLETGTKSPEAIRAYEKAGYRRRGPFGRYAENGSSVFMEKAL